MKRLNKKIGNLRLLNHLKMKKKVKSLGQGLTTKEIRVKETLMKMTAMTKTRNMMTKMKTSRTTVVKMKKVMTTVVKMKTSRTTAKTMQMKGL